MAKSTSKLFPSEETKEIKEDVKSLPEAKKEPEAENVPAVVNDDIQDVDISAIKRKRFRINGDNNKIIELNTSDMNVVNRMSAAYERLQKHMQEVGNLLTERVPEDSKELTVEQEEEITSQLAEIDEKMKEEIDYIFDAPISDKCADGGSMYDPFNGQFRFEHIIEAISKLYGNNLDKEFNAMKRRVSAKTSKYTKKYHN